MRKGEILWLNKSTSHSKFAANSISNTSKEHLGSILRNLDWSPNLVNWIYHRSWCWTRFKNSNITEKYCVLLDNSRFQLNCKHFHRTNIFWMTKVKLFHDLWRFLFFREASVENTDDEPNKFSRCIALWKIQPINFSFNIFQMKFLQSIFGMIKLSWINNLDKYQTVWWNS